MGKFLKQNISLILIGFASLFFVVNLSIPIFKKKNRPLPISRIEHKTIVNHKFVVFISAPEKEEINKKNLKSIFEQNYPHFRVIYLHTKAPHLVEQWCKKKKVLDRMTFTTSFEREIKKCEDHEVLLFVQGRDWLAHTNVLNWLNRFYENPFVQMTYGSYVDYPSYRRCKDKEIPFKVHQTGLYAKAPEKKMLLSHLRSGYAYLFKEIRGQQDPFAKEFYLPALEKAGEQAKYVRDVLYIHNREREGE